MREGDVAAENELLALVRSELHGIAERAMRNERAGHTLQATALVHEAWIRMVDARVEPTENRAQFLALAARAMRNVLVDHARRRKSIKRGGDMGEMLLDEVVALYEGPNLDVLALEEALAALAERDSELARIVELRFFAGLPHVVIGQILAITDRQVERAWVTARAFLHRELSRRGARG